MGIRQMVVEIKVWK